MEQPTAPTFALALVSFAVLGCATACGPGRPDLPPKLQSAHDRLTGKWRQELGASEKRVIELMKMALEHPEWRRQDVQDLDVPRGDRMQLREFVGLLRADPDAKERMRRAVQKPGMWVRFQSRTVVIRRDDLSPTEMPYRVVGAQGSKIDIVIDDGDRTTLTFQGQNTFTAPWGRNGGSITFHRVGG